ncbi:peptidylprolyl isomerase [Candidatus Obscuribacterales bacterium]|nr:peptidylprolyl isomerase [Candidatus Obscuribacterales bacterium]
MISKCAKLFSKTAFLIALMTTTQVTPALADSLPPELVPPDVTLTNQMGTSTSTSASSVPDSQTPGIGGGAAKGAQPPPAGSNAKFGFFAGHQQQQPPPGVPAGHKGMPVYPPGQQPPPQSSASGPDPIAVIQTNRGTITIRLFKQFAPKTVEAFTEMVNSGFYNGLLWHRVEPGFVIQGGCPNGNGSGLYIDPKTNQPRMLMLESSPLVKHNAAGVVAMARFPKNPNSASCQFYITLGPQPNLDFKYTVFGGVISGLDVVQRIQKMDKIESITMQQQ